MPILPIGSHNVRLFGAWPSITWPTDSGRAMLVNRASAISWAFRNRSLKDDPDTREILDTALTAEGATVRMAAGAEEALALFNSAPPTIILTDITPT